MCGRGAGEARTATSANPPFGAIAMPAGEENWALAPMPSRKPEAPVPASVVVDRVAMSMRRMRWLFWSCDAACGGRQQPIVCAVCVRGGSGL